MKELTIVIGIVMGILAGIGSLLGLSLFIFGNDYGSKLGGMAIVGTMVIVWGVPAAFYSTSELKCDEVDRATKGFCRWINRICLIVIGAALLAFFM